KAARRVGQGQREDRRLDRPKPRDESAHVQGGRHQPRRSLQLERHPVATGRRDAPMIAVERRALLVALALTAFVAVARAQNAKPGGPAPGTQAPGATAPGAPLVQRVSTFEREAPAGYGTLLKVYAGPHGGVQVSAWRDRKVRI